MIKTLAVSALLLLTAHSGLAQSILITNTPAAYAQSSYDFGPVIVSAFYGETEVTPNAAISSAAAYIGVNSSAFPGPPAENGVNGINDRDGILGGADQERLRLAIKPGYYLTNLTWNFSRADGPQATDGVRISGFSTNPGAIFSGGTVGTPIYTNGILTFQITAFNNTVRTVWFTNLIASTNATLEITVVDSTQAAPQFAMQNFTIAQVPPTAPQITTQPVAATRYEQDGTNVFSVGAFSAGTISYQWYKTPATPVVGGTNATLTIPNLAVANAGNYYVTVSNSLGGTVNSDTVALTVNTWTAPSFSLNPTSVSAYANQTATFTALATGSPTWSIGYQWQKGGVPISGATGTTLTLNNITAADVASYTCIASNGVGSPATSAAASLTLLTLPAGTYAAAALGTKPLIYHRYSDVASSTNVFNFGSRGNAGNGGLSGFYTPSVGPEPPDYPNFESGNPAPFYDAFSANGTIPPLGVVSNRVTITAWVNPSGAQTAFSGLVYHRGPSGTSSGLFVKKDSTATYDVLAYSWNDLRFGITNDTLALPANRWSFVALVIEPTRATLYLHDGTNMLTQVDNVNQANGNFSATTLIGWDSNGGLTGRRFGGLIDEVTIHTRALSSSEVFSLFASASNYPPTIVNSPQSTTNFTGQPFSLAATAQGTLPMSYQWHKQGSGPVAGATNDSYSVASAVLGDAGNYFLVATNLYGAATSTVATVTIVAQSPIFTTIPQSATNWIGLNATFTAAAIGSGPITYQWAKVGSGAISGATNASLTLSNLTQGAAGDYFVTAVNPQGSSNSPAATLTVLDANLFTQVLYPTNGYTVLRQNFTGVLGTQFQMGSINRTVTHLGYFDADGDGLTASHEVGIYTIGNPTGTGTLLGGVTVPAGTTAPFTNGYRWVALSTPVTLTNDQSYTIAASATANVDAWPTEFAVQWNEAFVGLSSPTNRILVYTPSAPWPTEPTITVAGSNRAYPLCNLMSVPTASPAVTLLIEPLGSNVRLTWPQGTLEASGLVTGTYTNVPGATSPYVVPATGAQMYFRVKVN